MRRCGMSEAKKVEIEKRRCPWCDFLGDHLIVKEDIARKEFECRQCGKSFFDTKLRSVAQPVSHQK